MIYDIIARDGKVLNTIISDTSFAESYAASLGATARQKESSHTEYATTDPPVDAIKKIVDKIAEIETINDARDAVLIDQEYNITIMTEIGGN